MEKLDITSLGVSKTSADWLSSSDSNMERFNFVIRASRSRLPGQADLKVITNLESILRTGDGAGGMNIEWKSGI